MANIYAQANGNWSNDDPATGIWFDAASGGSRRARPGVGDVGFINPGVAVALDEDPTCTRIQGVGTGLVTAAANREINADLMADQGTLLSIAAALDVVINGNLTGGNQSTAAALFVNHSGANVVVNGNGISQSGAIDRVALRVNAGDVSITSLTGSSVIRRAAEINGGVVSVGTATGGTGAGGVAMTVNGGVVTINDCKRGSWCVAVECRGGVVKLVQHECGSFSLATGSGVIQLPDGTKLTFENFSGNARQFYGAELLPAAADVRGGVEFGGGDYVGVLAQRFSRFGAR